MKWFLSALFLLPLLSSAAELSCQQLSETVERIEIDLMNKKSDQACAARTGQSTMPCASLGTIETRLAQLKNARALLEGIGRLKTQIGVEKERLRTSSGRTTQRAALGFVDAVITAQSLQLLSKTGPDNGSFLISLKAELQKVPTPTFIDAVKTLCGNLPEDQRATDNTVNACGADFDPSQSAINEMTAVINGPEFNSDLVRQWRSSLAIVKEDESPYSFSEMRRSLPTNSQGQTPQNYTAAQINALRALPDFINVQGFDFMSDLNSGRALAVTRERFNALTSELQERQKREIEASVSRAFFTHKDTLSLSSSECTSAKSSYDAALACASAMRTSANSTTGSSTAAAELLRLLNGIEASRVQINDIETRRANCLSGINESLASADARISVEPCEGMLSKDEASYTEEITNLEAIKTQILADPAVTPMIQLRDYAIAQMRAGDNCVPEDIVTLVGSCEPDYQSSIPKELRGLSNSMMNIVVLLAPATDASTTAAATAAVAFCGSEASKSADQRAICAHLLANEESREIAEDEARRPREEPIEDSRPERRERRPFWEGVAAGLPDLSRQLAQNQLLAQQQAFNPIITYPSVIPNNQGPVFFPAVNPLAGLSYVPTAGATYYSSFLPGASSYTSVPTATAATGTSQPSSFFNFNY